MTPITHHINGVPVWRMRQSPNRGVYNGAPTHDACVGCLFKNDRAKCPEDPEHAWRSDPALLCQDVTYDSAGADAEFEVDADYVFILATDEGMAAYVAHRMEDACQS